jgi:hypothetical protein
MGCGRGRVRENNQRGSKLSIFTAGIHQETPFNIDFGVKNERQNYRLGTVWGYLWEEGG